MKHELYTLCASRLIDTACPGGSRSTSQVDAQGHVLGRLANISFAGNVYERSGRT